MATNELTRDEIKNMPAGLEMDKLIAQHIFGFTIAQNGEAAYLVTPNGYTDLHFLARRKYSKDIRFAWKVVEHFADPAYYTEFLHHAGRWIIDFSGDTDDYGRAETAPLAICRAALLAWIEAE